MAFELQDFTASGTDYVARLNNNNAAIEAAILSLQSAVLASVGDGAELILDAFDREGIVGTQSYALDLDAYDGGDSILIGRRPAPDVDLGEANISVAWASFAGVYARVTQTGDVTLNASSIVSGLPKTIYVGIPSGGTAQLYEDTSDLAVLYIYSMTWDGFTLTNFKRLAPYLPGYETLQKSIGSPRQLQIFDNETDWTSDTESATSIVIAGAQDDNEILVDGSMEVIGMFVDVGRGGPDAFEAMEGMDGVDIAVQLKVMCNGVRWNLEDLEIDASAVPDTVYAQVDVGTVGDERFVTEVTRFSLEREAIGAGVVSARAFSWGLIVRPLVGVAVPKDNNTVILI